MASKMEISAKVEKELGKTLVKKIESDIQLDVKKSAKSITTQSAWIDHYLLIDFGFSGNYFIPNSIQFYSSTNFLCSKTTDNNSLVSLIPILNCKYVKVTWDTATSRAVHIYGYQPKNV